MAGSGVSRRVESTGATPTTAEVLQALRRQTAGLTTVAAGGGVAVGHADTVVIHGAPRRPILDQYLRAVARMAAEHPYPGVRTDSSIVPPLPEVYVRQSVEAASQTQRKSRRTQALRALGGHHDALLFSLAVAMDSQLDAEIRTEAAEALVDLDEPEAAATMLRHVGLSRSVPGIRRVYLARRLVELEEFGAAAAVCIGLLWDAEASTVDRSEAFSVLASMPTLPDAETCFAVATDPDLHAYQRMTAAEQLATLADPRAADVCFVLAHDESIESRLRLDAARILGFVIGDGRAANALMLLAYQAESMESHHRMRALVYLERLGDSAGAAAAYARLTWDAVLPQHLRTEAVEQMARLGHPDSGAYALRFAYDPGMQPDLRVRAAAVLARSDRRRAADVCVTIGYDPQSVSDARATAAIHLAETGDPRAANLLVVLAYDQALSGVLRIRIATILQRLAPQRAAGVWAAAALDTSLPAVFRHDAVRALVASLDLPPESEQAATEVP